MPQPSKQSASPGSWKDRRLPTIASLCRTLAQDAAPEGVPATIRGWLAGRRSSGKLLFLSFRDGSGFAQVVVAKAAVPADAFEKAQHCPLESAVEIVGAAFSEPRAPGGMEIRAAGFAVLHAAIPIPSPRRNTGLPSCWTTGICG